MNMKTEPAQLVGYITAAVTAVIALLVAYGFEISQDQQTAILGVVAVIAPIVAGLLIRGNVYSAETHDHDVDAAYRAGTKAGATTGNATIPNPPQGGA